MATLLTKAEPAVNPVESQPSSAATTGIRFHLSLNVNDLEKAIGFYRLLFGVEPAKCYDDYAKFELADPPLVLSLEPQSHAAGGPEPSGLPSSICCRPCRHPAPTGVGGRTEYPRGRRGMLLRQADQVLGQRSRRQQLGDVRRRSRRCSPWRQAARPRPVEGGGQHIPVGRSAFGDHL